MKSNISDKLKKVSVVIPNYNKQDYLISCIDSVLKQTYRNIEIVIVDDCSTDNSRTIIKEMAAKHENVIAVFLPENRGVCNARNRGAQESSGHYLTFLDSDDVYINNNKIENEVKVLDSDVDIAYSQWVPLDVNGEIISETIADKNIYGNRYGICKILSVSRPGYQQLRGYLFTKKLFNQVGGYTFPYNYFEDFDFQCRLVLNGRLKYTKEYGEGYRNVPGGLSKQKILNAEEIIGLIQKKYFQGLSLDQKVYFKSIFLRKKMKESYVHLKVNAKRLIIMKIKS